MATARLDASTPISRKIARLTDSRNLWKSKYQLLMPGCRVLEATTKSMTTFDFSERRVRGSSFSVTFVLFLCLMRRAAASLRGAAAAIEISEEIYRRRRLAGPAHETLGIKSNSGKD